MKVELIFMKLCQKSNNLEKFQEFTRFEPKPPKIFIEDFLILASSSLEIIRQEFLISLHAFYKNLLLHLWNSLGFDIISLRHSSSFGKFLKSEPLR